MNQNQKIADELLKQAHIIEARGNHLASDMIETLLRSHDSIIAKIAKIQSDAVSKPFNMLSSAKKIKYLDALKREVEKVLKKVFEENRILIDDAVLDSLTYTAKDTTKLMNAGLSVKITEPIISTETVKGWFMTADIDGLLINEALDNMEAGVKKRILQACRQCLIENLPLSELVSRIKASGLEASAPYIRGLARTIAHSTRNNGHLLVWQKYEAQGIVAGYRYLATLDKRTCLVCGVDDGKLFMPNFPKPNIPRHYNCRCIYAPETVDKSDVKRPINKLDGKSEKTTKSYQQWMKSMLSTDPEFVESILGPTRFKLFRDGKLTLDKMIQDGKIKRLSDL